MKRHLAVAGALVLTGVLALTFLDVGQGQAQRGKEREYFKENIIGEVPNQYGDFVSLTGTTNNWALSFKNKDGEIRILQFRGNKLSDQVFTVKRKY